MTQKAKLVYKGGTGSGHFGHAGRPGKRGGSSGGSVDGVRVGMYPVVGYHVTSNRNMPKIKTYGLKGSEWPEDNNFENSFSDPFTLYADGAVFAFPTLQEAKANAFMWDDGSGVSILRVYGQGLEFEHYAEGAQIVVQADTANYEIVQ